MRLLREKDQWGKSFGFEVNGVPIFAKGADVIPFDSFPDRVTPEKHRQILESARDANMNMVRLWGGGYYESDDFYDECDRLGLMVWQDFMFGGAIPPDDPEFRANVEQEAIEQVDRLRDHPSLVLWCRQQRSGNRMGSMAGPHCAEGKHFSERTRADRDRHGAAIR